MRISAEAYQQAEQAGLVAGDLESAIFRVEGLLEALNELRKRPPDMDEERHAEMTEALFWSARMALAGVRVAEEMGRAKT